MLVWRLLGWTTQMKKWQDSSNVYADKHIHIRLLSTADTYNGMSAMCLCSHRARFIKTVYLWGNDSRGRGEGVILIIFRSQWSSIPMRRNVVYNPALNETYYREDNSEYFCTMNVSCPDTELRSVPQVFNNQLWTPFFPPLNKEPTISLSCEGNLFQMPCNLCGASQNSWQWRRTERFCASALFVLSSPSP